LGKLLDFLLWEFVGFKMFLSQKIKGLGLKYDWVVDSHLFNLVFKPFVYVSISIWLLVSFLLGIKLELLIKQACLCSLTSGSRR
jgi:hypothetical protein